MERNKHNWKNVSCHVDSAVILVKMLQQKSSTAVELAAELRKANEKAARLGGLFKAISSEFREERLGEG